GDPGQRIGEVRPRTEELGHLVDRVDEGEGAQLRELRRHGVRELERETGEGRHRPRDVTQEEHLGPVGSVQPELRVDGHATGGERVAHRLAEIETAPSQQATTPGEKGSELAGERDDRVFERLEVRPGRMHQIDVLGQGPTERAGDSLSPPVFDQTSAYLVLDRLTELLDPGGDFFVDETAV